MPESRHTRRDFRLAERQALPGTIGEDFDNPVHILRMNDEYHDPTVLKLPSDLRVINHAYDGDLNCYDLSRRDDQGRISICYCEALESLMPEFEDKRNHLAYTIADYLVPNLDFWERNRKVWRKNDS